MPERLLYWVFALVVLIVLIVVLFKVVDHI
jgi:hypothetical protein